MSEKSEPGPRNTSARRHREARAQALQKALRENLRRRKSAVSEPEPPATDGDDGSAPSVETSLHEKAKENGDDGQ